MLTRFFSTQFLLAMMAVIALSACSKKDDEFGDEVYSDTQTGMMTGGMLDGSEMGGNPQGGTQADLVVSVGDRVFFGYDQADLSGEARTIVERQVEWLKQYPAVNIAVEGHADERGTREYNLALGDRRANAVQSYMVAMGIEPRRIRTISYGKERPAVPGSNPTAWAQNRRGVVVVE